MSSGLLSVPKSANISDPCLSPAAPSTPLWRGVGSTQPPTPQSSAATPKPVPPPSRALSGTTTAGASGAPKDDTERRPASSSTKVCSPVPTGSYRLLDARHKPVKPLVVVLPPKPPPSPVKALQATLSDTVMPAVRARRGLSSPPSSSVRARTFLSPSPTAALLSSDDDDDDEDPAAALRHLPRLPLLHSGRGSIFLSDLYRRMVRQRHRAAYVAAGAKSRAAARSHVAESVDATASLSLANRRTEARQERQRQWLAVVQCALFVASQSRATEMAAMNKLRAVFAPIVRKLVDRRRRRLRQLLVMETRRSEFVVVAAQQLAKHVLFTGWSEEQLGGLTRCLVPMVVSRGQFVAPCGDVGGGLYILDAGCLDLVKVKKSRGQRGDGAGSIRGGDAGSVRGGGDGDAGSIRSPSSPKRSARGGGNVITTNLDGSLRYPLGAEASFASSISGAAGGNLASSFRRGGGSPKAGNRTAVFGSPTARPGKAALGLDFPYDVVSTLSDHGDLFGDLAVCMNDPCPLGAVVASAQATLWKIDRVSFMRFVTSDSSRPLVELSSSSGGSLLLATTRANQLKVRSQWLSVTHGPTVESARNLGENSVCVGWTDAEVRALLSMMKPECYHARDVLFSPGDEPRKLYLLAFGAVQIARPVAPAAGGVSAMAASFSLAASLRPQHVAPPPVASLSTQRPAPHHPAPPEKASIRQHSVADGCFGGSLQPVATLAPWACIGVESAITFDPRSAQAMCLTDVGVWSCDRESFLTLLRNNPRLFLRVSQNVERIKTDRFRASAKPQWLVALLRADPLFARLPMEAIQDIAAASAPRWVARSDHPTRMRTSSFFVLLRGSFCVRQTRGQSGGGDAAAAAAALAASTAAQQQQQHLFHNDDTNHFQPQQPPHDDLAFSTKNKSTIAELCNFVCGPAIVNAPGAVSNGPLAMASNSGVDLRASGAVECWEVSVASVAAAVAKHLAHASVATAGSGEEWKRLQSEATALQRRTVLELDASLLMDR